MRIIKATIIFFILCTAALANDDCAELLTRELTTDERFQAYLSDLLEEGVLGRAQLKAYRKSLKKGVVANPVTESVAASNYEALIHRDSLQEYVDSGELTLEGQLEWTEKKLRELEWVWERREIVREETRKITLEALFLEAKMIPLEGGKFTMGSPKGEVGRNNDEGQVAVELSPFEIMDAPVTQRMWYEVMGNNPSHFKEPVHCKNHTVIGGVLLCPDHPVERVGWDDVQEFLKEINRRLGLKGRDRYRLPTEAQWEYAARAGTTTAYSFGDDAGLLEKYAVYNDGQTRPVRSKLPNPWGLYDMHGNVREWTQDRYSEELPGGVDPVKNHCSGIRWVLRGGCWNYSAEYVRSGYRGYNHAILGNHYVGFRLVRSL